MGVAVTGLSAGSAVDTRHFQSLRRRSEAGKRREEGMAEPELHSTSLEAAGIGRRRVASTAGAVDSTLLPVPEQAAPA